MSGLYSITGLDPVEYSVTARLALSPLRPSVPVTPVVLCTSCIVYDIHRSTLESLPDQSKS